MNIILNKPDPDNASDLVALQSEIEVMKQDLAAALKQFNRRTERGAPADEDSDTSGGVFEDLAAQGERAVEAIARQVEQQPVVSVLIAFSIGYMLSRVSSR